MTCLNAQFQNPFIPCLAEALLAAPGGGGIAVYASSGLCEPAGQAALNRGFYQQLFSGSPTLGEAAARAKAATANPDVRRTWIFFGDPSSRLRP